MEIVKDVCEMRLVVNQLIKDGESIGFVPTMGALHDGHTSLIRKAREDNQVVVVSIFVNHIQFDRKDDLIAYPVQLEKDHKIAKDNGADIIFEPDSDKIYPDGFETFVDLGNLTNFLCGAKRPGHFRGVATIVAKLFNIVKPHNAYFGQKDFQQSVIIKRIVRDLNIDVNIVVMPIVRNFDGLAYSSRNTYLSDNERSDALSIYEALKNARSKVLSGEFDSFKIIKRSCALINSMPSVKEIEYIAIVDCDTLEELKIVNNKAVMVLAVWVGGTRLIDNCKLMDDDC